MLDCGQYGRKMWTKPMMMDWACMGCRRGRIDPPNRCWHRQVGNADDDEHWSTWMMW